MTFVFFHGIDQQDKTADQIRTLCIESIRVGLDRAGSNNQLPLAEQMIVPYYGDLLARLEQPVDNKPAAISARRGLTGFGQMNTPFGQRMPVTTLDHLINEMNNVRNGSPEKQVDENANRNRGFKSNTLGALSKVLPISLQNQVVNRALTQVAGYLDDASLKRTILEVASVAMSEGTKSAERDNESLIVIAHSLGTVIALEALADFNERGVDLLMTIGSPLSSETVASRMHPKARNWPHSVRKWINISDPEDLVALHHSIDRRNFLKNCSDRDPAAVWNIIDIKNHMDNHHGIVGYLDDPVVAQLITDKKLWS
jgi:hypothetical protein